jgi:hypothetical protein
VLALRVGWRTGLTPCCPPAAPLLPTCCPRAARVKDGGPATVAARQSLPAVVTPRRDPPLERRERPRHRRRQDPSGVTTSRPPRSAGARAGPVRGAQRRRGTTGTGPRTPDRTVGARQSRHRRVPVLRPLTRCVHGGARSIVACPGELPLQHVRRQSPAPASSARVVSGPRGHAALPGWPRGNRREAGCAAPGKQTAPALIRSAGAGPGAASGARVRGGTRTPVRPP